MNICFWQDRKGATAVEFAMIALPFFWLLIGIVELALYFTTASLMTEAANAGARLVRTGQLEGNSSPEQAFKDAVCNRAAVFVPCADIQYQVQNIPTGNFIDATGPSFDAAGNLNGQGYQDGQQSSVMLIRLAYRYPFLTPVMGDFFSDAGPGNTRLILNTIVLKNEPYDF